MKFDSDLRPIPDLDDANKRRNATSGNASGINTSGTGASNPGDGANRATGNDGIGGTSRGLDDGSTELPLGSERDARGNARRTRGNSQRTSGETGRARARGRGSNSGDTQPATDSPGVNAAETETRPGNGDTSRPVDVPPKPVDFGTLSGVVRSTAKNTQLTKEFLAEGWGIAFQATGFFLRDKDTWTLDEDTEANELADRTLTWFRNLDPRRSKEWEKRLATWQPLISLLIMLVTITGPRIAATRAKRRVTIPPKIQTNPGNAAHSATDTPVTAANHGANNGRGNEQIKQYGPVRGVERPLRAQDIDELFGEPDPG